MAASTYTSQLGARYGYPQAPPSPPMEDSSSRCSLPSIHNLIGLADRSPTTEQFPHTQQNQASTSRPATRPNSSHYSSGGGSGSTSHAPRLGLPPTPPMSADASFDGYHSPAMKPANPVQAVSASSHYYETTPPAEDMRHTASRPATSRSNPSQSYHAYTPTYATSQPPRAPAYTPSPSSAPQQPSHMPSMLYQQRPLPQSFPPLPVAVQAPPPAPTNSPWQHHHYISPSSAASFPQSQDRYICQTCNKAFSRPSSLRIHSHSHTGEKPFKCPHAGCEKAFSVRSNMKRHERGCHSFEGASSPAMH